MNGASPIAPQRHILVVEDEQRIAQIVIDYVKAEGWPVRHAADGMLALHDIRREPPSLVVLDLMLPSMGGIELCQAVRQFSSVPIIMLTARVDELDRLLGLETGADDYVCKPFSPRELMARIKAQLRRAAGAMGLGSAPWLVDEARLQVVWRGVPLGLTPIEFRLLRALLEQPGRVFSRAQLMRKLYDDDRDVSDRAIDSHVKNVRRKIASVDPDSPGVASVYGAGYCVDWPG